MILLRLLSLSLLILAGQSSVASLLAQESTSHTPHHSLHDVQIDAERVADGIFMLTGEGGNMGVQSRSDFFSTRTGTRITLEATKTWARLVC